MMLEPFFDNVTPSLNGIHVNFGLGQDKKDRKCRHGAASQQRIWLKNVESCSGDLRYCSSFDGNTEAMQCDPGPEASLCPSQSASGCLAPAALASCAASEIRALVLWRGGDVESMR